MASPMLERKIVKVVLGLMIVFLLLPTNLYAVVGQEEGLDEFEFENLRIFHQKLTTEEAQDKMEQYDEINQAIEEREKSLPDGQTDAMSEELKEELAKLRTQLLQIPKRDRFRIELNGDYNYDSNVNRNVPRQEKGDSILNARLTTLIDLSGRKTDLRYEVSGEKQWNIVFSEKDTWQVENRLRYRRKYFSRLIHSLNSAVTRHNSKTTEIDGSKVRYDFNNQTAYNFPFSRKLSLNTSFIQLKRLFLQEAFDQDSNWQVTASPSTFWNFTPKSRLALGYNFGASRIRSKSGDSNAHDITLGYFGQITRKSSASINLAYGKQVPRSRDTAEVRTVTAGIGYIWQMTPKTQITFQATRSLQNSTAELTSGSVDGENTTSKSDTHITTDNLAVSFNSRIMRKMTAILTLAATHTRNTTFQDATEEEQEVESRQFAFPIQVGLSYRFREWMILSLKYSYYFRTGNEKAETARSHLWSSALRLVF